MIVATLFLLVVVAFVAKMVWDVQQIKKIKTEVERLQYLAGIEVPELDTPIDFVSEIAPVIETEPQVEKPTE